MALRAPAPGIPVPPQTTTYRTGRPPKTSRAALLNAAREIGFVDLSAVKAAARAGVKPATFYRHFATFDELLAALVDDALSRAPGPLPDLNTEWRAHLAGTATTLRQLCSSNPGLAAALDRRPGMPDVLHQVWCRAFDVLVLHGFSDYTARLGVSTVLALATDDPARANEHGVSLVLDGLAARELAGLAKDAIEERDSASRGVVNVQGYELHQMDGAAEFAEAVLRRIPERSTTPDTGARR